jgi:CheY-like chemotaxis protein
MNVLVVEDNESVADSLSFLLECFGHRAVVAYDGETALTLLRPGAFEIAFIDENLPGIKGSSIALSLRNTPARSRPFLVSITGDADSQEHVAHFFDVCLQKPFSSAALTQAIEDAQCICDAKTPGVKTLQAA